jgi:membrane protease YdiL (CAAX protease family)
VGDLLKFFLLTFAVTWTCFITVAVAIPAEKPLGYALVLMGAFAPSYVALALTAWRERQQGVRSILRHVVQWRVAKRWYLFAVLYIVAIKLTVALILRASTGAWPRFGTTPWYVIPVAIAFSTPFQAGEEIGWRGYALPRLSDHLGLRRASIYLGVIWAVWHLPQFFIRASDTYGQSFLIFAVQVVAVSVALAWLWNAAAKSLLLPMLLHSAVNNSKDIVPSATPRPNNAFGLSAPPVAWVTVLLLWVVALYLLTRMPGLEALRLGKNRCNSDCAH